MSRPHVTVRMYKGLLGDCFLLRLFRERPADSAQLADSHILIDCGILQRAPEEKARIARVAEDIAKTCNRHLDLVVVTHQHYDHLCGFGAAEDLFLGSGIAIDHLWLAWTERPGDAQAGRLAELTDKTRMAIAAGVNGMNLRASQTKTQEFDFDGPAAGLDGFIGPLAMGVAGKPSSGEILQGLKDKIRPADDDYLEPGQAKRTPGKVELRAFVLGPPRNEERLFKGLPSRNPASQETYFAARDAEILAAQRNFGASGRSGFDGESIDGTPFAKRHRQIDDVRLFDPNLPPPLNSMGPQAHLWDVRNRYLNGDESWRRIETDWHGPVGALALKLDSDTNNTSLVLAFEVEPGGEVLLFAADAQVGNWLSWGDQSYPKDAPEFGIEDILARTVLYKVGHHASHNATLKGRGLELMTHDRLVAMIPVVEQVAQKRRWPMPYGKLYARLLEKTNGRILRGDAPPDAAVLAAQPWFSANVREHAGDEELGPLWVEYDIA